MTEDGEWFRQGFERELSEEIRDQMELDLTERAYMLLGAYAVACEWADRE